jgi:hypothetical protein
MPRRARAALFLAACAACGGRVTETESPLPIAAPDAGVDAATEDAATTDAPPIFGGADAYIDPGVPCGSFDLIPTLCDVRSGKVCCMPFRDSIVTAFKHDKNVCQPRAECASGVAVECNGPGDCANRGKPGAVCCVHYASGAFPETLEAIRCLPLGECQARRHLVLCDSTAPEPCPAGQRCTPLFTRPTVEACR